MVVGFSTSFRRHGILARGLSNARPNGGRIRRYERTTDRLPRLCSKFARTRAYVLSPPATGVSWRHARPTARFFRNRSQLGFGKSNLPTTSPDKIAANIAKLPE